MQSPFEFILNFFLKFISFNSKKFWINFKTLMFNSEKKIFSVFLLLENNLIS